MNVRKRWRELLAQPGLTLVPGAYDALSAKIMQSVGFEAIAAGGYAAIGSLLAQADNGQSNYRDYADHYGRMCDAVDIPVYVDADTGFGGINNVREVVRAFERAGVAGLFIGDQVFPNRCFYLPGKAIVPVEEMLAKLKAALDARTDPNLFIAARTDAKGVDGENAAIERSQMALELGCDMAKPSGFDTIEDLQKLMKVLPGPYMANQSHAAGRPKVALSELERIGISTVSFPSAALFAAAGGVMRTMKALFEQKSFESVQDELIDLDDYYSLVGLQELADREQRYNEEAAAIVSARKAAE